MYLFMLSLLKKDCLRYVVTNYKILVKTVKDV